MNKAVDFNPIDPCASIIELSEVPLKLPVVRREALCDGVVSISLSKPKGLEIDPEPGAHLAIDIPGGVGPRHYSVYESTNEELRIAVRCDPDSRGGAQWLHRSAVIGLELEVLSIRNNFPFRASPRNLFIAGGIGITPIIPMIKACEEMSLAYQVVYCGRNLSSMPFVSMLEEKGASIHQTSILGRLNLSNLISGLTEETHIHACGPNSMLNDLMEAAKKNGISQRLYLERFSADVLPKSCDGFEFDVICERSKKRITVTSSETMLAALRQAGIEIQTQCEQGICGACETKVVGGAPDHRDSLLSEHEKSEGKVIFPCVSRSLGKVLRLDI